MVTVLAVALSLAMAWMFWPTRETVQVTLADVKEIQPFTIDMRKVNDVYVLEDRD